MPPRPRSLRIAVPLLALAAAACTTSRTLAPPPPPVVVAAAREGSPAERRLVQRAHVRLVADDPAGVVAPARALAEGMGGYLESSTAGEGRAVVVVRLPAASVAAYLDAAAEWGQVRERRLSVDDVTDAAIDLEARLRTLTAVRDRLRGHLDAASTTQDVIAVERELARVQAELESLQARADRLRHDVDLARVTVEVERRRVLGPLGALLHGLGRFIGMLFVLR
jgi:hypothetical protein